MRITITLFALLLALGLHAQKKQLLESKEDVAREAKLEFEQSMTNPEGDLYLFAQDTKIEGEYTFKITLGDRGKVTSVFAKSREGGSISFQNGLKDQVKDFKFNFKLPKNKDYSFEYTFKF